MDLTSFCVLPRLDTIVILHGCRVKGKFRLGLDADVELKLYGIIEAFWLC